MSEPAFSIGRALTADARATVYQAQGPDGQPVLLKVLEKCSREPQELEHLQNELNVAGTLDPSKVLRPLFLSTYQGMPALIREDFGGIPLERLLMSAGSAIRA